jgi:hypothetical protein
LGEAGAAEQDAALAAFLAGLKDVQPPRSAPTGRAESQLLLTV